MPPDTTARILIVTSNESLAAAYLAQLQTLAYEVEHTSDGAASLQHALDFMPDLILLDTALTQLSSYDLLDILRHTPETAHTHIIVLDSIIDPVTRLRATELGAADIQINSLGAVTPTVARVRKLVDSIHA